MRHQLCSETYPQMTLHHNHAALPLWGRTTSQATISFICWTLVITSLLREHLGGCRPCPCEGKRLSTTAQHLKTLFAEGFLYMGILASASFASVNFKAWIFFFFMNPRTGE